MKRRTILALCVVLMTVHVPSGGAEPLELVWEHDLGPGLITTSPLVDGDHLYVRTSKSWSGEDRPEVHAFTLDGEPVWNRTSTTTQHDMSPLRLTSAGSGPCGSWPSLLLVGWANGAFTALHPENGTVFWSVSSEVRGWGITGAALVDDDHVVVPTRTGLMRLCLADGSVDFVVELSLGWRNGVTKHSGGYWVGSETGTLWNVSQNGTVERSVNLTGKLRHPPLVQADQLLLHVQHTSNSTLFAYNPHLDELTTIAVLGGSPAVPLRMGELIVLGTNAGLTTVVCGGSCNIVETIPGKVNGELSNASDTVVFAPLNQPNDGWLKVEVDAAGNVLFNTSISTPYDDYATAAPAYAGSRLFLGNDAGVLMAYDPSPETSVTNPDNASLNQTNSSAVEQETTSPLQSPQNPTAKSESTVGAFGAFGLGLVLAGAAWFAHKGRINDAWRVVSLCALVLGLMMLPDVSDAWTRAVADEPTTSVGEDWDDDWPNSWTGTQVVVFEFEETTVVTGGLEGHPDVWSLTQAAADTSGLTLTWEATGLGLYVTAINGTAASGWEYFLNGERGAFAVDESPVESSVVLRWRLA